MAGRKSPWGGGDKGASGEPPADADGTGDAEEPAKDPAPPGERPRGPRNPWLPTGDGPPRRSAGFEDLFRPKDGPRKPGGGGGGGFGGGFPRMPQRPDGKSWVPPIVGGLVIIWLFASTVHMVGPKDQGLVTTFGSYSRTIHPGVSWTMPWPIQSVDVTDVTSIRRDTIPDSEAEKLMLTSDKNLVDLSYLVRWTIKDLKLFKFRLDDPEDTVKEVAEAAMRATVAEVQLNEVIGGTGRGKIEQNVRVRMQAILDGYKAGVLIQGVELKKTDPPEKVVAAFQNVNVAQQQAEKYQADARAWAGQVVAIAQGEAASFDKVYGQYKLAPEVTRRRLYYETMERVLRNNEKVILETNGVTPYLPLPEVRRRASPAEAQPATGGQ
ncbi:MAG: protease modulator HflK [Novosphingobium sp.]